MTLARQPAVRLTAAIVLSIYTAIYFVNHSARGLAHPDWVGAASLFDLTITLSGAFYFLLVRRGYASWFTLTAVATCSLRASAYLVPSVGSQTGWLRWISVPLELLVVAKVLTKLRSKPGGEDPLTRIRSAVAAAIPYRKLAHVVAIEVAVLYYALFSWRSKPEERGNAVAFSYAEASGYSTISLLLVLGIVCEAVPLHFVLLRFSHLAAWIWTALDGYALLGALAILRSTKLRTIVVNDESLLVRIGILSEAKIPLSDIASCVQISRGALLPKSNYWNTTVLGEPQHLIELHRPVTVVTLWRQHRQVTRVGVAVDEGSAFAALLIRKASAVRFPRD